MENKLFKIVLKDSLGQEEIDYEYAASSSEALKLILLANYGMKAIVEEVLDPFRLQAKI